MKKIIAITATFLLVPIFTSRAQDASNVILKVYADFYKGLNEADNSTAFEVSRVYLGYKGAISEHFSAEVKLDIGSPEDLSEYSLIKRYAYFKTASLSYEKKKLKLVFGLLGMSQFSIQEKDWGYRYILKSFMDEYSYGPSADMGFSAFYKFNSFIEADLTISNGEGYKSLQSDNSYKTALGINLYPLPKTTIRFYYDLLEKDVCQQVFSSYIAYKSDDYRIGAEYNLMMNKSYIANRNQQGISLYGTYNINNKWAVFGRHDRLTSNIPDEESQPWNLYDDGTSVIAGIEYRPVEKVKVSCNYQDWYAYAANGDDKRFLFFNLEFKL